MTVPAIAQRSAERTDLMLAHTGNAARRLLRRIRALPGDQQIGALQQELAAFDSRLPADVRKLAEVLRRDGMRTDMAMERALALALADAVMRQAENTGRLYQRGGGYPMNGLGSLGNAGSILTGMAQGIACSSDLRSQAVLKSTQTGGAEAGAAAQTGFDVLRGGAQCPDVSPAPAPESVSSSSSVVPIVVGLGVLAVAGGVVWAAARKKA